MSRITSFNDIPSSLTNGNCDLEEVIELNLFMKQSLGKVKQSLLDAQDYTNYEYFEQHTKMFNRNEFSWSVITDDIDEARAMTNIKGLSEKDPGKAAWDSSTYLTWTFVNGKFYQEAFPLHMIQEYIERPFFVFGTPTYDKTLRLQSDLLQIFFVFHLQHDFRFERKMTAGKYKITDPFTRVTIREKNRSNKILMKKYFNKKFNLKAFVFKLFENYFPNVSWRYLGAGHFAHRLAFQITEFLYQLGLWTYEDNERLIKLILEKTENLAVLEDTIITATGLQAHFSAELKKLFEEIREYLSSIILHSIVLINDKSLQESLSYKRTREGVFKNSHKNMWENAYHKDREMNNLINTILMKYLMRYHQSESSFFKVSPATTINFNTIFMMISNGQKDDVFAVGNELVTEELIQFHLTDFSYLRKQKAKKVKSVQKSKTKQEMAFENMKIPDDTPVDANQTQQAVCSTSPPSKGSTNFLDEACEIRMNSIDLIDNIMNGGFGTLERISKSKYVDKTIKFITDWISKYMSTNEPGLEKNQTYFKQLALGEKNLIVILLILSRMCIKFKKPTILNLVLNNLELICKDNLVNQAQLFLGQGYCHYSFLNKEKPLLGALVTTSIFEKNNTILYMNPEIFEIILEFYEDLIPKFETKKKTNSDSGIDFDNQGKEIVRISLAIDRFNTYFLNLVDIQSIENQERSLFYDLKLQNTISKVIFEKVLPTLYDEGYLAKKGLNEYEQYDFTSRLENIIRMDVIQAFTHFEKSNLSSSSLKGTIYDTCYSFLILFNKISERVIFDSSLEKAKPFMKSQPLEKNLNYLFHFKEGLEIKREILRLIQIYRIFPNNHLLTGRSKHFKSHGTIFFERSVPGDHSGEVIKDIIIEEFKSLDHLKKWDSEGKNSLIPHSIERYLFLGFFPMIYKYCKGIVSTFFLNNKKENISDLMDLKYNIDEIFKKLLKNLDMISKMSEINISAQDKLKLKLISNRMNRLKTKKKKGEQSPQNRSSQYKDLENSGKTDNQMEPTEAKKDQNIDEKTFEEIMYPELYQMRKKGEMILDFIETIYPLNYKYVLKKFIRVTANSRITDYSERSIALEKLNQYYNIKLPKNLRTTDFDQPKKNKDMKVLKEFKEFSEVKKKYRDDKAHWLQRKGEDNLIISFLNNNRDEVVNTLRFILTSIHNEFKDCTNESEILTTFFGSKYTLPYILYLNHLIVEYDLVKWGLFYFLNKEDDDFDSNYNKNIEIFKTAKQAGDLSTETAREVLSLIIYIYVNLGHFCMFKTFQDEDWGKIFDTYYSLGSFIKDLCENNATYFKRFFSKFIPKLSMDKKFNTRGWTTAFLLYVRMESFNNVHLMWAVKDTRPRLSLADKPEVSIFILRYFEIVTEFITGPCPFNQRLFYKYKTDTWMGFITRSVDDVDSVFYTIKNSAIDYILGIIEGEGTYPLDDETIEKYGDDPFFCSKYMTSNLTTSQIFKMIFVMIKKLALARKMQSSPSFREMIEKRVQEKRRKYFKHEKKLKLKSEKDLDIEMKKLEGTDYNFSKFDNKESTVTQEMMDVYKFKGYKDFLKLYKKDPEFSNHQIIQTALKLYSLLETLSNQSKNIKLFLVNAKLRLSKFYGEKVDQDDRVKISTKDRLVKIGSEMPEDMNVFMFILKISKRIEINIHPPGLERPLTKLIYFPLQPSIFYLQEKTKDELWRQVDLENKRMDFQKRFTQYFIEMDQNYEFNKSNGVFYWLTKNDTFNKQKIVCWIMGLIINAFIIAYYKLSDKSDLDLRKLTADDTPKKWINIGNIVFASYSFLLFLFWLFFRSWRRHKVKVADFKRIHPTDDPNQFSNKVYISIYMTFFQDEAAQNFLAHAILALFGILFNPFFSSLHLILIINISSTAKYVIQATFVHFNQLAITLVMALFMIYSFATLNSHYFSGTFDTGDIDVCSRLSECNLYMINLGLRNGGGIADSHSLYDINKVSSGRFISKTIFDLFFFFFINVISLNIVFGIIIDTFSEMRGAGEERKEKLSSSCFICANEPATFEEAQVNWEHHQLVDHEIWLYPFYIKYLEAKDSDSYTGDEIEVWDQYANANDNWIPNHQTAFLKSEFYEDDVEQKIEKVSEKVEEVQDSLEELKKQNQTILRILSKNFKSDSLKVDSLDDLDLDDIDLDDI